MFLSFADVMCFFISVYRLIRVSEKCQNILFLLLKRRERLDFHRYGIPSNFSFPKLLFIEYHTIISEVCFYNREFHYLFFWVSFWESLWLSFWIFCPPFYVSCPLFCLPPRVYIKYCRFVQNRKTPEISAKMSHQSNTPTIVLARNTVC